MDILLLEKEIVKSKQIKEKLQSYFDFEIPNYIVDDIKQEEYYSHLCLMINVATLCNRISEKESKILKNTIKTICTVTNIYDKVKI